MKRAYLTIDDSPSPHTDRLVDFLADKNIQAILFCRGDYLEQNPAPLIRAIEKNMVIANHSYSHLPAASLEFKDIVREIEKTESLINECYKKAKTPRSGKYFRFPYLDKGDGDRLERRFAEIIENVETIDLSGNENSRKIQDYLKNAGFSQPFKNVTHPLYKNKDVAKAADCLFTYSSCDWMLTKRHKGHQDYKNIHDLKQKINEDLWLCHEDGAQITLFHDQPDIETLTLALISHMIDKGFEFLKIT